MDLNLIIVPDGSAFFAQGVDLDYAAQGDTVEEAKKHFALGFRKTLTLRDGDLTRFKRPPEELLVELLTIEGAIQVVMDI